MPHFSKIIAWTLASLSFGSASLSTLSKPALAGEPIIDRNCQVHNRTPEVFRKISPQDRATIVMTSPFQVNNQQYSLQLLKFPNSTNVLCLKKPTATLPQRLTNVAIIQDKVIEKIEKDTYWTAKYTTTYILTVRGDESENILRTVYKLNLTDPNKPQVTTITRVYKN